jgi:hypothetical protein
MPTGVAVATGDAIPALPSIDANAVGLDVEVVVAGVGAGFGTGGANADCSSDRRAITDSTDIAPMIGTFTGALSVPGNAEGRPEGRPSTTHPPMRY